MIRSMKRLAAPLAIALAGCSTMPADNEVLPPSKLIDATAAAPTPGATRILVKRSIGGEQPAKCNLTVSIDGKPVAELLQGEGVTFYAPPGDHVVAIKSPVFLCQADASLAISASADQARRYRIRYEKYIGFTLQPAVE